MSRQSAIDELKLEHYSDSNLKMDKEFLIKKIGMNSEEFDEIISSKPIPHSNYPSYNKMLLSIAQFKKRVLK